MCEGGDIDHTIDYTLCINLKYLTGNVSGRAKL